MLKKMLWVLVFSLGTGPVWAAPGISEVSGTLTHGSTIAITGSGFGAKTQAAPYIWDDCSGTDPWVLWDFVYPYTNDPAFKLTYRTPAQITKANGVTGGVALPHARGSKYFAGAHYNTGALDTHAGWDVCAGKNNQQNFQFTYISYYYTVDPDWHYVSPDSTNDHNFKEYDWAAGSGYMGDIGNLYFGLFGFNDPAQSSTVNWGANYGEGMAIDNTTFQVDRSLMTYYDAVEMPPPQTPTYAVYAKPEAPSPNQGWQKVEYVIKHNAADGFHVVYQNNRKVWEVFLDDDNVTSMVERSETVFGGYAREASNTELYKNNWRYYADVYYDHTLARVMLANNADYTQATIIEPQIPIAWSGSSIQARLNLGRLPDSGRVYLFVFDADGNRNTQGYPLDLATSTPLKTPTRTATPTLAGLTPVPARVKAYPNPAQDRVVFNFADQPPGEAQVQLYNAAGERVAHVAGMLGDGHSTLVWETGSAAAGIYFYQTWFQGRPGPKGKLFLRSRGSAP